MLQASRVRKVKFSSLLPIKSRVGTGNNEILDVGPQRLQTQSAI
jgi:hypothetical protein